MNTKILLFLLLFLGSLQQMVATQFKSGGIEYIILDEEKFTCGIIYVERNLTGKVNVPTTVPYKTRNYTVVEICNGGFAWCQELTSVTLPNTITRIGIDAFKGCYSLTSVNIPDSITEIDDSAFSECWELKSIVLPNSLVTIGNEAFHTCRTITRIEIPSSVKTIGFGICEYCENLESIYVSPDNPNYVSDNGSLLNKDGSILLQGPTGYKGSYSIPETVKTIDRYAFRGSGKGLKSFSLPNSVSAIGDSTFYSCYGLTSITIPNSVQTIGEHAFAYCHALKEVILPNSITTIASKTFTYCTELESVTIPNSVKSIGGRAFEYCTSLTDILIPDSVTTIGVGTFGHCESLSSIDIPNSVTSIGGGAFEYCESLSSIDIPNSVTSIEQNTFLYCKSLSSIDIPNSVTTIGQSAFGHCESLSSIDIPNSVTSIGSGAFQGCTSLKDIAIPESITKIEESTFNKCTSLISVSLPNSVTSIGVKAFNECNIKEIACYAIKPPLCGSDCFNPATKYYATLQVPAKSLHKYKSTRIWNEFRNMSEMEAPEMEQIILDKTAVTMIKGETLQLTATILPPEATDYTLYWTSSNNDIATVSQTGLVSAVGKGHATIKVSSFDVNIEATCEIEVVENSGIEDILADKGESIVVYNLQGLRLDITSKGHLSQLPAGIYLVNGKKYILK